MKIKKEIIIYIVLLLILICGLTFSIYLFFTKNADGDLEEVISIQEEIPENSTTNNNTIAKEVEDEEVANYNAKFEKYFGKSVSGEQVIELLEQIILNNTENSDNIIGIDTNYTYNGEKMTGQNNKDTEDIENTKLRIDASKNYIVQVTDISIAYSDEGYIRRITIADESELTDNEIENFNSKFNSYFGKIIKGTYVKEYMKLIDEHNKEYYNTEYCVRVLFHTNKLYVLTGIKISITEEFGYAIIDDEDYYIDEHEYRANGMIYKILIADKTYMSQYIDNTTSN